MFFTILAVIFFVILFGFYFIISLMSGKYIIATIILTTAILSVLGVKGHLIQNEINLNKERFTLSGYSLIHVYEKQSERSYPSIKKCEKNSLVFLNKKYEESDFKEAKFAFCMLR